MKYGEKLRQKSIPAWSAYNIDYDDVKLFIKARTTTGLEATKNAAADDRLKQTEDELFIILDEQHRRIDLFVKSKAREVQHRLNDAKKRLRQLAARHPSTDKRLSANRLERYSRLENDVLKAGEEIKSLARFTTAQRTGFGKLLKKYKKWTGSLQLEDRFRQQVLSDTKSFINYDIGPLLDDYSETLHNIRALYTSRIRDAAPEHEPEASSYLIGSSIISQLHASIASQRRVDFDTAIATVPLGEHGSHATYFVHPENAVELQVLLVQHLNFYMSRSRQNSINGPVSTRGEGEPSSRGEISPDYFWLAADNPDRFVREQDTLNTPDWEARAGSTPQRARIAARWNTDEEEADALIAARVGETHVQVSKLRKKHVDAFFDKETHFPPRRASVSINKHADDLAAIRAPYANDKSARPLYLMSCHRTRFIGLRNSAKQIVLATLDTGITIRATSQEEGADTKFPFAVLIIRQEGQTSNSLIAALNDSHLVERVNGFSMEYHAIWELFKSDIPAPFWSPMLNQDIRKLPPPALKHSDTSVTSQTLGSSSGPDASTGTASVLGGRADSSTAVEELGGSIFFASDLEQPPLRAFRKKRRREFPEGPLNTNERYWSEYDHPEDEDQQGAYVIFIDPNEKSTMDKMLETVSKWFSRKRGIDEESLLHSPTTPKDDESSSDEEAHTATPRSRRHTSYGTVQRQSRALDPALQENAPFLPQPTGVCLVATAVILIIGYVLSATGRHRYNSIVRGGVVLAFASSLLFVIAAVVLLARAKLVRQMGVAVAVSTVLIESIAAGGLLAQLIG